MEGSLGFLLAAFFVTFLALALLPLESPGAPR